jgi:hypothetical protein
MATKKTNTYINEELIWMDEKLAQFRKQVDEFMDDPKDRYGPKEMPNGKVVQALISSREEQVVKAMAIMEKIPKVAAAVDELREKEAAKREVRGDQNLTPFEEGTI